MYKLSFYVLFLPVFHHSSTSTIRPTREVLSNSYIIKCPPAPPTAHPLLLADPTPTDPPPAATPTTPRELTRLQRILGVLPAPRQALTGNATVPAALVRLSL